MGAPAPVPAFLPPPPGYCKIRYSDGRLYEGQANTHPPLGMFLGGGIGVVLAPPSEEQVFLSGLFLLGGNDPLMSL